jgi:hypothetical protein
MKQLKSSKHNHPPQEPKAKKSPANLAASEAKCGERASVEEF